MVAYVLGHKSRPMMVAFLVFRIVVDLLDGTHALIGGHAPIVIIGFTTAALEIIMLVQLRRFKETSSNGSSA